jgi:ABC-type amino acid transport system permease subunit
MKNTESNPSNMKMPLAVFIMGFFIGLIVGTFISSITQSHESVNRGYARGVKDCQDGTPSYNVFYNNGKADTTYLYPYPKYKNF